MTALFDDNVSCGKTADIFGIQFTVCTLVKGISLIEEMIQNKRPQLVILANVHTLNLAFEQGSYKNLLKEAGLVLRDGAGTSWALKKKGIHPLHNFVGTNFIPDFCRHTVHKGYKFFLLGSRPGIAPAAADKLMSLAPGLNITGSINGYFSENETDRIISQINKSESDVLLVAMGNPKQEQWIADNLFRLNTPVCIGVGALFDYLSGRVRRAPEWMLNNGMEWIFRLVTEPTRLWKRYIIGNPRFLMRVKRELSESRNA